MNRRPAELSGGLLALIVCSAAAWGGSPPASRPVAPASRPIAQVQAATAGPVAVAVLDYDVSLPGQNEIGKALAEILSVRLSADDAMQVVEREQLDKVMKEQRLRLVGVVDQDQAVKVGKLVGARLLVMGKGFVLDKKLVLVTKVVGVETGLVRGSIRNVELTEPISQISQTLAEDVAGIIRRDSAKLLPAGEELADALAGLRARLPGGPPITVAVVIPEEHRTTRQTPPPSDPAAETEIKRILLACGFKVVDVGAGIPKAGRPGDLADWARQVLRGSRSVDAPAAAWPASLAGADVVVVGTGISEFAARTGDLITCTGQVEINVVDRRTGIILMAERQSQRSVDLAEVTAGKSALEKAGHRLGMGVATALMSYRPPANVLGAPPPGATSQPAGVRGGP